jgi:hypothetical protein
MRLSRAVYGLIPGGLAVFLALVWLRGDAARWVALWKFESHLARRMEVVRLARDGKLQLGSKGPCRCFYAAIPTPPYSMLSKDGKVLVSRHSDGFSVTFFIETHGLFPEDNYSAFVFRENGTPRTGDEDTDTFAEIRLLRPHWFFVRHT